MYENILSFLLQKSQYLAKPADQPTLSLVAERVALDILAASHSAGFPIAVHLPVFLPALLRYAIA